MSKPEIIYRGGKFDNIYTDKRFENYTAFIEKSAYDDLKENLETKNSRTVNAAYHALLEMSAWMGIPEKKRIKQVNHLMENVRYCAEKDLRKIAKAFNADNTNGKESE